MKKRILLVEDEPGLRLTLTDRLSNEGYEVATAADGESGFARASSEGFDLVSQSSPAGALNTSSPSTTWRRRRREAGWSVRP